MTRLRPLSGEKGFIVSTLGNELPEWRVVLKKNSYDSWSMIATTPANLNDTTAFFEFDNDQEDIELYVDPVANSITYEMLPEDSDFDFDTTTGRFVCYVNDIRVVEATCKFVVQGESDD